MGVAVEATLGLVAVDSAEQTPRAGALRATGNDAPPLGRLMVAPEGAAHPEVPVEAGTSMKNTAAAWALSVREESGCAEPPRVDMYDGIQAVKVATTVNGGSPAKILTAGQRPSREQVLAETLVRITSISVLVPSAIS
jgi:hypothetical protein